MKALIAAAALIATPAASMAQYIYSQPTYSSPSFSPAPQPYTPSVPTYNYVDSYSNMLDSGRQQLNNGRMQREIDANTNYRRQQQLRGY